MTEGQRPTVLIVEDNYDNLSIYTTILEHYGYVVLSAEDGITGVDMAKRHRPDLILMDVSMPGISGWDATRTLKNLSETASIPILVLTAHALSGDRERAFDEGADGYIAKPAEPMRVVQEVRRLLTMRT